MIYDLQRASLWKRISAFLFDVILLGIAIALFAWGLSAALDFDRHNAALDAAYARYGEEYGVDFGLTLGSYEDMPQEELDRLNAAYAALNADAEAVSAYNTVISMSLMILSLGTLLGYAAMEFVIPLRLGNGQTLGKKIFGVALMQQDGVKVSAKTLFIRTFLGKYTFETMVPVLILLMIWFGILGIAGTVVVLGILLLQLGLVIFTRKRTAIHDAMAATVAVDLASQMIFPDRAAMIAYIEKVHAEKAAQETY